jgi:quercetin dioxygenase-like cupin family protein
MDNRLLDFKNQEWKDGAFEGIYLKVYEQNQQMIRLVKFNPGFIEPDWCKKRHVGFVLEGSFDLEFPDKTLQYKSGDGVFMDGTQDHKHIVKVTSNDPVILFLVD